MIADPNQLLLEGLRRALEQVDDIEVVGATHLGSQLVELVGRRRPEVVMLDLAMRTATGQCCLDALRAAHPGRQARRLRRPDQRARDPLGARPRRARLRGQQHRSAGHPVRRAQRLPATVFHAVGAAPTPDDELRAAGLTNREITMLKGLARGLSNRAMSQELWVTEQTVKFHLGNLYRKLGVPNRLAAASYAHAHGVLDA